MVNTNLELQIPLEHPCYEGHFPGAPLVPGALLIYWILSAYKQYDSTEKLLVKRMKFFSPVLPGMNCTLSFEKKADKNMVALSLSSGDQVLVKGKLAC